MGGPFHDLNRFGSGEAPGQGELVIRDGLDVLDKESATAFFSGKTWDDVLAHLRGLRHEPVFRGAYFHEEWSVLSPPALAYYARAYLEFLCDALARSEEEEEFVFYFLGALYQVFHVHKGSPFTAEQTESLRQIVEWIYARANALELFDYFVDDIRQLARQVLNELDAHRGHTP